MTANGYLTANGSTMIAFRVEDQPAAWSSTDGRHWTSVTMHGSPDLAGGRILYTPIGIVWEQGNGAAWLGELAWN